MEEKELMEQASAKSDEVIQQDPITEFYNTVAEALDSTNGKSPFGDFLLNNIKGGKKTVYSKTVRENRVFDVGFLDILETSYPHILRITKDPKKTIRYEQEVVGVEKAKKVDSSTIRHLASHTHLIKSIENDNVIPSKVLATFSEEEMGIYENRFIKTLMFRVDKFLQVRYDIIKSNLESFQSDRVKISNQFPLQDNMLSIDIDIAVKKDIVESVEKAKSAFDRVTQLREVYKGLKNSEFMVALKSAKTVNPPIMRTNIIMKNPDFKIAYALWTFLDRFDGLGYDVSIKEKNRDLNPQFSSDIELMTQLLISSAIVNQQLGKLDADKLHFKEYMAKRIKIKNRLDDELSIKPETYKLKDNDLSEFMLQTVSKYFAKSMREHLRETKDQKLTLKRVYKEMLEVINMVYPQLFDINDTEDKKSNDEKLKRAIRKAEIIKTVRKLKEDDLAKTIREEEKAKLKITQLKEKIALDKKKKDSLIEKQRRQQEKAKLLAKEKEEKAKEKKALQESLKRAKEEERLRLASEKKKAKEEAIKQRALMSVAKKKEKIEQNKERRNLLKQLQQERKAVSNDLKKAEQKRIKEKKLRDEEIRKQFINNAYEREKQRIAKDKRLEEELLSKYMDK